MSIPFFNLDNVRTDRFVRLDPTSGRLVAPLKKGMQSWQALPFRRRKGLAILRHYTMGAVTLESTAAYAVFKIGNAIAWTTHTNHFSGQPTLTIEVNASKDIFTLSLRAARFPGTEVSADFTAVIYAVADAWKIDLSFDWGGFQASADFAAWLANPLLNPLVSTLLNAGEVCAFAGHKITLSGSQRSAVFLPCWGFMVTGHVNLEGLNEPLTHSLFAINLLTPEMPGSLNLFSRRRTLLTLGNPWDEPWFSLPLQGSTATDWHVHAATHCFSALQMEFAEVANSGKISRLLTAYSLHPDPTRLVFEPGADWCNDVGDAFQLSIRRPVALLHYAHQVSVPQVAVVGRLDWQSGWLHTADCSIQLGKPERTGFVLMQDGMNTLVGHPVRLQQGKLGLAFKLKATAERTNANQRSQPVAAPPGACVVLHLGQEGSEPLVPEDQHPLHVRLNSGGVAKIE